MSVIPSIEQLEILESIKAGKNVKANSMPGSGKTTSILTIARELSDKNILQVTYNKSLKLEVREKTKDLSNILIHTYHSLALYFFDVTGYDDNMIKNILEKKLKPKRPISFDLFCIDETQDQTQLYFSLMKYVISFNKSVYQLYILGDEYQGIYEFKGTDIRFLTFADRIWGDNFETHTLSTSYRLTHQIANFINEYAIHEDRIKTVKDGPPVCYIRCDPFDSSHSDFLMTKMKEYEPEDIFILSPSIKGDIPVKHLENILVKSGIPCYFPVSDDTKLDEDIINGKVVFCTFHQSKGRERKCVIVYNFDMSYFTFYARDFNPNVCPNTLYVALSRASEQLIVLESFKSEPCKFLKKVKSTPMIDFREIFYDGRGTKDISEKDNMKHETDVTGLLKFIKDTYVFKLQPIMDELFSTIKPAKYRVQIPDKIKGVEQTFESVSEINGLVIPCIYECETRGISTIISYVDECMLLTKKKYIKTYYTRHINEKYSSLEQYVYYTMIYMSLTSGVINNLAQIVDVSWMDDQIVDECHRLLSEELSDCCVYEVPIVYDCTTYTDYGTISLSGRMDAIDRNTVYEIKCVESLTLEHYLQLIVYAWMAIKKGKKYEYKLINIKTGEVRLLQQNRFLIDDVMLLLFKNKFGENKILTNDEFLSIINLI